LNTPAQFKYHAIVFAKAPLPGYAKTRLIPALGEVAAAELAAKMLHRTVFAALDAGVGSVELCVAPSADLEIWQQLDLPNGLSISEQGNGDLGQRMARAMARGLSDHSGVLLMGTDCPDLTAAKITEAAAMLQNHDCCMVPVQDGGYSLIGLTRFDPHIFNGVTWSSEFVAEQTRQRLADLTLSLAELACLRDIDNPDDLANLPPELLNG
jgi:rSAM/selenodomain-associated transferase 1